MENNLEIYRIHSNFSKLKLALILKVSIQIIEDIETGKLIPDSKLAYKISNLLQCKVNDIFPNIVIE